MSPEEIEAWGGADPAGVGLIRTLCQWHIAPVMEATVRFTSGGIFTLPTLKLVELVSLTSEGVPLDVSKIDVDDTGTIQWCERSSRKRGGLVVTFRHGHETAPPELIPLAARLQRTLSDGVMTTRVGNISVTPAAVSAATEGLEPHIAAILARYTLPPLS